MAVMMLSPQKFTFDISDTQKMSYFSGTWRFVTMFTNVCRWSVAIIWNLKLERWMWRSVAWCSYQILRYLRLGGILSLMGYREKLPKLQCDAHQLRVAFI